MSKQNMTPSDRVKAWSSLLLQLGEWETENKRQTSNRVKAWSELQLQLADWDKNHS